jgi:hypothetical protein
MLPPALCDDPDHHASTAGEVHGTVRTRRLRLEFRERLGALEVKADAILAGMEAIKARFGIGAATPVERSPDQPAGRLQRRSAHL